MADLFYRIVGALGYDHPLHPVLTHLVIGPVVAAFVFELIGVIRKKESFRRTAWYLSIFALVAWVFTVTNGFFDWIHFYNMSTIREITIKIVLSGVLLVILISVVTVHRQLSEKSIIPLILLTLATLNVGALGFFGGNLVYGGSKEPVAAETTAAPEGWNETKVNDFTLDWRVNADTLDIRMSAPTTGWVGVGFGTTGTMAGSDIYLGYVDGNGNVDLEDSFGQASQQHMSDVDLGGTSDVSNVSGEVQNGTTTISFTIPLDSGDPNDVVYAKGNEYKVILAYGPNGANDTVSYHGGGGRFITDLTL